MARQAQHSLHHLPTLLPSRAVSEQHHYPPLPLAKALSVILHSSFALTSYFVSHLPLESLHFFHLTIVFLVQATFLSDTTTDCKASVPISIFTHLISEARVINFLLLV